MTDSTDVLDLDRMRRERRDKLRAAMADQGLDALLLLGGANVGYATGACGMRADSSRAHHEAPLALVLADDEHPHLFTAYPEGAPDDLPADHVHLQAQVEFAEGVQDLAKRLADVVGQAPQRLGVDQYTAPMHAARDELFAGAEHVDATPVLSMARVLKTADEVECVRRAQCVNELAMFDVQRMLRPGVRQADLSGRFLRRVFELGATGNGLDPIWQVMPESVATGPYSVHGDLVFPTASTDRILTDGDVVWVDSGVACHGYMSDFGRTWVVGAPPRVSAAQRHAFERWRAIVERVLEAVRPGATGADLTRVAREGEPRTPWPDYFYLAHGLGLDSAEMPLIGTDLGPEFDESVVLAPGMILVLEPMVWDDDGSGGYRAEEIVVVTDDGYRLLSDYPYEPYE